MSLRDYLRDEITEECGQGYITARERDRRLRLFDDPAVLTSAPSAGTVQGYLARPRTTTVKPSGILVIHEKFGLTSYIKDVARRLAMLGYVALAPDLLWRQGGTAAIGDSGQVAAILGGLGPDVMISDLQACVSSLSAMDGVRGDRIGAIGFCFGGGLAWRLATRESRLAAVVPFYGPNPPLDEVPSIRAPVLGIYAGIDERINPGIGAIEREMKRFSRTFEVAILPDSLHAFHNDTLPERYHPRAAQEAWAMATAWFARYLSAP